MPIVGCRRREARGGRAAPGGGGARLRSPCRGHQRLFRRRSPPPSAVVRRSTWRSRRHERPSPRRRVRRIGRLRPRSSSGASCSPAWSARPWQRVVVDGSRTTDGSASEPRHLSATAGELAGRPLRQMGPERERACRREARPRMGAAKRAWLDGRTEEAWAASATFQAEDRSGRDGDPPARSPPQATGRAGPPGRRKPVTALRSVRQTTCTTTMRSASSTSAAASVTIGCCQTK